MRKFLAAPFEAVHVMGTALFFGVALFLTLLTAPEWMQKLDGKVSPDSAARHFHELASLIGRNGLWVACAALVGGVLAPYARGDGKKALAWVRVVCAASAAIIVLMTWGRFEGLPNVLEGEKGRAVDVAQWRSDKKPTPWNGLLFATGLNLFLGAFQISGGAGKKAKADGGDKSK
jgi:hypothetical protein